MNPYVKNPACSCSRCRSGRLFGPAMIITVGVLFLLQEYGVLWFHQSWPVLLLIAGLFSFLAASASTEGHVQPYGTMPVGQPVYGQPGYAQPGQPPVTGQPPSQPTSTHNDTQVNS